MVMEDDRDGSFARDRRPFFRMPVHVAWLLPILVGGAIGTACRATLAAAFPHPSPGFPWTTFFINIVGAFILGALLEYLSASGSDQGWRRLIRLGCGTGILGGLTTYSSLAVETVSMVGGGAAGAAGLYAIGSVALGAGAAFVGIRMAAALHQARRKRGGTQ